tara:strand:- start:2953 stop:3855 length:903 start_codon:yes stop_codon:yes gene_type:complete
METEQPWWCKHYGATNMFYYIGKRVYAIHYNTYYDAECSLWMVAYGASIYTTESKEMMWKEFKDEKFWDKTTKDISSTAKERFMRFPVKMHVDFYPQIPHNQRLTRNELKEIMESSGKFWKKCCCRLGVKAPKKASIISETEIDSEAETYSETEIDSENNEQTCAEKPKKQKLNKKSKKETTINLKKSFRITVSEKNWITHKLIKKLRKQVRQTCQFKIETPKGKTTYFVSYRMISSGEISFGYAISKKETELSISEKDELWIASNEKLRKNPIFTFSNKKQKEYLTNVFAPLIENQTKI